MAAVFHFPSQALAWVVMAIFAVVYLGMLLGGLPRLKLDRSGVALLGAIAVIAVTGMAVEEAARAVDLSTLVLLFAFMVVSAQMRLGGFYTAVTRCVGALPWSRAALLAALIGVAALLSAVFSNDVVCLAMTPVVIRIASQRGWAPVPMLLGLACAANIGSAATLIGNPQNMLIGSVLQMSFVHYLGQAWAPVMLSLLWLWAWLCWGPSVTGAEVPHARSPLPANDPPFNAWQTGKGLAVSLVLVAMFLFTEVPRDVAALVGAGILLLSRRLHSAEVMRCVDWSLLLLFIGLFVVNHAFESTGLADRAVTWLAAHGVRLNDTEAIMGLALLLSNAVSNVPAVMLLLPHLPDAAAGTTLALASTFAGNLLLVGSIANLIVVDLAQRDGVSVNWRQHAVVGLPVTLGSLLILWAWRAWLGA